MKKTIAILLALWIATLISCNREQQEAGEEKAIPVEVVSVRQGVIAKEIKFTGSIEAVTEVQVYPKITARIEEMQVDAGDSVSKGDVIVHLESDDLEAQVAQAKAALEVVQAQWKQVEVGTREEELAQAEDLVAKAKAQVRDAENNYQRMKALYRQGSVAKRQFETAELSYTVAKAELNSATERLEMLREGATREERQALRAQVNQAKAALELARIRLSYARVTSPIAGTVSERFLDPGNLAVPGKPLLRIVQMDTVKVLVYFPEDLIAYMRPGVDAHITVAAYPNMIFQGKIAKLSPTLDPETRMFSAEIMVPNKQGHLRPGMFTRVRFFVDSHPHALLVPKEAVLYREEYLGNAAGTGEHVSKQQYLFVAEQGKARMRKVVLGHESVTVVEIAEGLKPGDRIVVRGMHQLKDGAKIKVMVRGESEA
ncbi:MAG: efflux RND transporter periplasmic adaptor subunit [Thermodesulfobacteriota bacterium]